MILCNSHVRTLYYTLLCLKCLFCNVKCGVQYSKGLTPTLLWVSDNADSGAALYSVWPVLCFVEECAVQYFCLCSWQCFSCSVIFQFLSFSSTLLCMSFIMVYNSGSVVPRISPCVGLCMCFIVVYNSDCVVPHMYHCARGCVFFFLCAILSALFIHTAGWAISSF